MRAALRCELRLLRNNPSKHTGQRGQGRTLVEYIPVKLNWVSECYLKVSLKSAAEVGFHLTKVLLSGLKRYNWHSFVWGVKLVFGNKLRFADFLE